MNSIETGAPEAEDGEDEEGGGEGQGEEHGQPPGGGGRGRVILVSPLRRVGHRQRRRAAAHRGIDRKIDKYKMISLHFRLFYPGKFDWDCCKTCVKFRTCGNIGGESDNSDIPG